ncbi:immunoglobulin superfamily member 5 [Cololabis saira]|uniref:immunoglobulin superfamily member 5 n=1 Tax=Cololabis saira TaxID=129043 RepID=UPI002AD2715C|nr:immunoglobulin superfamily member 5 [Cololabis saira]
MTFSWKLRLALFYLCSLLCKAVTEELQLEPLNSTVLEGSNVQFNASVQGPWKIMTWTVGGFLILTVNAGGPISSSSEQYNATFCSSGVIDCVEFTIYNVTRTEAGPVTCAVQGSISPKTAQLYVQESGTVVIMGGNVTVEQDQQVELQCVATGWHPIPTVSWSRDGAAVNSSLYNTTSMADGDYFNSTSILRFQAVSNTMVDCMATVPTLNSPQSSSVFVTVVPNWTVLIAVVASFGSCALLVLLILGIHFCYKRKKASEIYQDEMSDVNAAGKRRGQVNPSYVTEGQTSEHPSDSGFFQTNGSSGLEMPDGVYSTQLGNGSRNAYNTASEEAQFHKHRHLTFV